MGPARSRRYSSPPPVKAGVFRLRAGAAQGENSSSQLFGVTAINAKMCIRDSTDTVQLVGEDRSISYFYDIDFVGDGTSVGL